MSPDTQGNIYWLASYPKSGNTWTRAVIANLLNEDPEPVAINELQTGAIASSRTWVETALDFDIGELSHGEVDLLRPAAYQWHSRQLTTPGYHKVHDAYTFLPNGEPLFPPAATRGALCIVRNPLDVAVSFAHHSNRTTDWAIGKMGNHDFAFCGGDQKLFPQLRQRLLNWSQHVSSWLEAPGIAKLVVRYEDMQQDPLGTFTRIATFLELPDDSVSVNTALEHCTIEALQAQESRTPFVEKPAKAKHFFRKGIVGNWRTTLTEQQVKTLIEDHKAVMMQFDYLAPDGQPRHTPSDNPALFSARNTA